MRYLVFVLLFCCSSWAVAIAWVEDYETARALGRELDQPVFVYFDARWCSWCHRYVDETLADPSIREVLRRRYVAVQVDWDARPDLVRHYGANGLPYTVLLAPDGEIMGRFLGLVSSSDLLARLEQGGRGLDDASLRHAQLPVIRPTGLDEAAWQAFQQEWLDYLERLWSTPTNGLHGLFDTGLTLKWPQPLTWIWLEEQRAWLDRHALAQRGEVERLWDPVDGGFFNYAEVIATHLETSKILDVNAWMAAWLAVNEQVLIDEAARSTLAFLETRLQSRTGAFYQALYADQDYYALDAPRRVDASPPRIDTVIRADSNGWAIWGLACAVQRGAAADETTRLAQTALLDVLHNLQRDGRLVHHQRDGELGRKVWPEDWLALLAAAAALDRLQPAAGWSQRLGAILEEAVGWVKVAVAGPLDSDRAALLAWVAVQPAYREAFPDGTVEWALGSLALEAETLPDRLIPGLAAWQYWLGREPRDGQCW